MSQASRLVLFAALSAIPASASSQSVERVVYASVLDRAGRPVTGITADDLIVRENKIDREVVTMSRAPEPVAVAVLVDTSQDAVALLPDAREALVAFVRALGGRHDIAVTGFGGPPGLLANYTRDTGTLTAAVGRIAVRSGSGAYLLDSLMTASAGLRAREGVARVLVVITSDGRELSTRTSEEVVAEVQRSGITVEALVVAGRRGARPATLSDVEQADVERAAALDKAIKLTGGRRQDLVVPGALHAKLQELAARLNNQYRVVYEAPPRLTPPASIEILTTRQDVRVQTFGMPRND